jgi:dipeptidyl aminopeptidase/acylaminoacyl peptidase
MNKNMKKFIGVAFLLLSASGLRSQELSKPAFDTGNYKKFNDYGGIGEQPVISNDGKFITFGYSTPETGGVFILESTNGKFKKEFKDSGDPVFTQDSHWLIFNSAGGMIIFDLVKKQQQQIDNARVLNVTKSVHGRWHSYQQGDDIMLKEVGGVKEKRFAGAKSNLFNHDGTAAVIQTDSALQWVSLPSLAVKTIFKGGEAKYLTFDPSGRRLAFMISNGKQNVIYQYDQGDESSRLLVSAVTASLKPGIRVADDNLSFSSDGNHVFFKLAEAKKKAEKENSVITGKVNVWNYKDEYLQPWQLREARKNEYRYAASVSVADGKVIQLESKDAQIVNSGIKAGEFVLVANIIDKDEGYWNKRLQQNYYLISIITGEKRKIISNAPVFTMPPKLSPKGKFVTWYDPELNTYRCYEVSTGLTHNITKDIKESLVNNENLYYSLRGYTYGDLWMDDEQSLLIYDQYDIWQVDPLGGKGPINITAGYGKANKISFRIAQSYLDGSTVSSNNLLLAALDSAKQNGFWRSKLGTTGPPDKLDMESCLYYYPGIIPAGYYDQPPVKAKNAEVYIVRRETASEYPNWYLTTDFKSFRQLTNVHPEKEYNWMTADLVHYNLQDGTLSQGILYKPENFEASKKYPVIFYYYENKSNELNIFLNPGLSAGALNIPWYVSNGYLVFEPDIIHPGPYPGKSALNSVISAAEYLSRLPYIDSKKMGLQGHSFGGYETNYIVTHTGMFAAANESSGFSDCISHYGAIGVGGKSLAFLYETGQQHFLSSPWERPDLYIENSPIFQVDKVTTPLLMMNNQEDHIVPFAQAEELFTAMRRLQKPAWMLQYDGEGHLIFDEKNQLDFTIRQEQFFDHYLKGKPAPVWMTEGIKASDKGLKSGLELDSAH